LERGLNAWWLLIAHNYRSSCFIPEVSFIVVRARRIPRFCHFCLQLRGPAQCWVIMQPRKNVGSQIMTSCMNEDVQRAWHPCPIRSTITCHLRRLGEKGFAQSYARVRLPRTILYRFEPHEHIWALSAAVRVSKSFSARSLYRSSAPTTILATPHAQHFPRQNLSIREDSTSFPSSDPQALKSQKRTDATLLLLRPTQPQQPRIRRARQQQ